jgi:hypothetical protein
MQVAVCNLASVNLSAFVVEEPGQAPTYDLQKLYEITKVGRSVGRSAGLLDDGDGRTAHRGGGEVDTAGLTHQKQLRQL